MDEFRELNLARPAAGYCGLWFCFVIECPQVNYDQFY
jgi:hypothetical protein